MSASPPAADQTVLDWRVVGTYTTRLSAHRAVDHLARSGFPVRRVAIVGRDPRLVELITGTVRARPRKRPAAWAGAAVGLCFGLVLSAAAAGGAVAAVGLTVVAAGYGAFLATSFATLSGTASGHVFTSRTVWTAERYDVVADPEHAEAAANLLIRLAWRGQP